MTNSEPIILAITGSIASGKSTVCSIISNGELSEIHPKLKVVLINADIVGHECYLPENNCPNSDGSPTTIEQIADVFGREIITPEGSINRQVLGSYVFGQPDNMKKLTNIVWPAIRKRSEEKIQATKEQFEQERNKGLWDKLLIVFEAAILIEAGWLDICDCLWITKVNQDVQIERLCARNGVDKEKALKMVNSQPTAEERVQLVKDKYKHLPLIVFDTHQLDLHQLKDNVKKEITSITYA